MKLALAAAFLLGSATAFAPINGARSSSAVKSAVADEIYTFTKSEEIFKEAQDVSSREQRYLSVLLDFTGSYGPYVHSYSHTFLL
jgi:hypothetical protein